MKTKLIKEYFKKVKNANKELPKKEAFKDLLNRLYSGDKQIEKVIDQITLGAESSVLNIPRKDKMHRGSADTLYNKIIIEFENDLKTTDSVEAISSPCWSKNGSKIYFASNRYDVSAKIFIYKVNIDGTNLIKLADNATSPDWSK